MRTVTKNKTCLKCGVTHEIKIASGDYIRWKRGAHIQFVAPYLSEDQRELLISGICGTCFEEMFAEDEE